MHDELSNQVVITECGSIDEDKNSFIVLIKHL